MVDKIPFDDEWEDRARETLDDVEFDTDLGIEMARDAERLANDEMTREEFNEKYHDRILDEFGMDARPTIDAGPERSPTPDEVKKAVEDSDNDFEKTDLAEDGEFDDDSDATLPLEWISDEIPEAVAGDQTRRTMLKKAALATGAVSIATIAERSPGGLWGGSRDTGRNGVAEAGQVKVTDPDKQMGMVIDTEACVGDLVCVDACERENKSPEGALWQFVFQYEEPNNDEPHFVVRPCQHCSDPPCRDVCPVRARHKRQHDGIVLTDYDICIGCRYCQVGCPYGVNYFQWGQPVTDEDDTRRYVGDEDGWTAGLAGESFPKEDRRGRTVAGAPTRKGVMTKCTFCVHRQDSGDSELEDTTACEESCPQNAIQFGDLTDSNSKPREYLRNKLEEVDDQPEEVPEGEDPTSDADRLSTWRFKEDRGTDPNVIYIGNEPGPEAEWTEDYVNRMASYDDMSLRRRRPGFEGPEEGGGH
ncbi:MAG: 4Fe-4S ferredoxin N-terminal domain-containing protein [Halobacteriota archaeon]